MLFSAAGREEGRGRSGVGGRRKGQGVGVGGKTSLPRPIVTSHLVETVEIEAGLTMGIG